jgi:hypothetical protein
MSAPPRTTDEYSRGSGGSEGSGAAGRQRFSAASGAPLPAPFGRIGTGIFAGAVLGAILLVVAEFTTLYHLKITSSQTPLSSEGTGPHDSYALIPIAVLILVLAFAVLRAGSRPALLAIGIAGAVALLIALLGDLPDVNSTGNNRLATGQVVAVGTEPGPGMYLETAGAIALVAVCGLGFLLLGRPPPVKRLPVDAPAPTGGGTGGAGKSAS